MKMKALSAVLAAAMLSGCTGMMYGGGVAPVSNQNSYYGQQAPRVAPQQQPMQGWQQPAPQQQAAANRAPAQAPAVTTVQNVPPSVRQQQAQQQQAQQQQAATQSNAPSPYGNAAPAAQTQPPRTASAEDGWSVRPNIPPTATDTPKVAQQTPAAPAAADRSAQPVRPPAREETPAPSQQQAAAPPQTPPAQQQQPAAQQQPAKEVAAAQPAGNRPSGGGSAVSTLLQKANSELGKGNLDGAAAYLEDAHRIDSKNANILYDIANIRYHQKRYREAEAAAAKAANSGGSNAVMRKSWSLIANARKALGDNQGAIAAAEKAASF